MKNKKVLKIGKRGFTLIELLLVMAIIGILAATIFVGMSNQRKRARTNSALQSVTSTMPYLVECYMKGYTPLRRAAGVDVCSNGMGVPWPRLIGDADRSTADGDCDYYGNAYIGTGNTAIANCGDSDGSRIYCNISNGNCWID